MKKIPRMIVPVLFFCFCYIGSIAQTVSPQVFSAGGDTQFSPGQNSLSWTIGEAIIGTVTNSSNTFILNQGFHQTNILVVNTFDESRVNIECTVFPNPTSDWINIEISTSKTIKVELLNLSGQILKSHVFYRNYQLYLGDIPDSVYMLRLMDDDSLFQEFKIVKI